MANELKTPIRHSVIGEIISVKDINKDDYKEGKFKHDCKIVRVDPLMVVLLLMFISQMTSIINTV